MTTAFAIRDFNPRDSAHAGRTKERNDRHCRFFFSNSTYDLGFSALDTDTDSKTEQRLKRINSLLIKLHKESPEAFEYFASNLEQGINLFSNSHMK